MSGRRDNGGERRVDAVTERDPEEQGSDIAAETEDGSNQPGRLAGTLLLLRDLWRLVRGEDQRARKVRWMLSLLRPYRRRVIAMLVALVIATAAGLAPPYLAGIGRAGGWHVQVIYGLRVAPGVPPVDFGCCVSR